jgi:ABC-2 type transport system ATP-binding protein
MLEAKNLRKAYGALQAVDGASLAAGVGQVIGLLGPNGAGKTTTIGMLAGLVTPDQGEVRIAGKAFGGDTSETKRLLGLVPQELALFDELSAAANLDLFGALYGLTGKRLALERERVFGLVGLADRAKDKVDTFSGGMKRRLNLAAALMHDPQVLLLDEPTVGVDPQSRNAILERIQAMRAEGRTVIYTTHYMEEAARICDRVAIIDHGKVLAVDTVPNLIAAHGGDPLLTVTTSDGPEQIRTRDPVGELARLAAGRTVLDFRLDRADLEQVFLNLTGRTLRD